MATAVTCTNGKAPSDFVMNSQIARTLVCLNRPNTAGCQPGGWAESGRWTDAPTLMRKLPEHAKAPSPMPPRARSGPSSFGTRSGIDSAGSSVACNASRGKLGYDYIIDMESTLLRPYGNWAKQLTAWRQGKGYCLNRGAARVGGMLIAREGA